MRNHSDNKFLRHRDANVFVYTCHFAYALASRFARAPSYGIFSGAGIFYRDQVYIHHTYTHCKYVYATRYYTSRLLFSARIAVRIQTRDAARNG